MEISSKEKEQEEWLHCLITIYCFDLTEEILAFFKNYKPRNQNVIVINKSKKPPIDHSDGGNSEQIPAKGRCITSSSQL